MPHYWENFTIGEFVESQEIELTTGPFGTQLKASEYINHGIPVINVRNIGFGNIRKEKFEYISSMTAQRLSKHLLKCGDIVFGRKGAVERHALIRSYQNGWFQGSDCLRLRVKTAKINPSFLSYCFFTPDHQQWMINQCSHGATMASLNQDILKRIPLLLPSIGTQLKVASILSAYDDLIENNTRRIAILEEMARRVYEEWFVHFRFPGHENVRLVESELGLIPEGWRIGRLDDALVLQRGFDLPTRERKYGVVPVFASTGIVGNHNEAKVKAPGIVTGRSGSLGTVLFVDVDFWPLNTTLWVKQFREVTPLYTFYLLSSLGLQQFNSGAAVPTLNRNDVHGLPVVIPTMCTLQLFDEHICIMQRFVKNLKNQNHKLRVTRDLLLPKLISGEIDVSEMDVTVEKEDAA